MSAQPAPEEPAGDGGPPVTALPPDRRKVGGRDLPVAIAVGVVLAGAFLLTTFLTPLGFTILVGVLVLIAVLEAGAVFTDAGWPVARPVLTATAIVALAGTYELGLQGQVLGLAVLLLGAVAWELADPQRHDVVRNIAGTVLLGLWVPIMASFAILLITRPVDAAAAVLAVVGAAIISDIGAFAVGVTIGRHRIAPTISPNKTWEGLIGGLLLAVLLAVAVLPNVGELFDVPTSVLLAVAGGLAGFTGDLAESMVKRDLGVKDLGSVLPGHGGVLDRVDGILFALPVGYYVLELMGR